jgi:hypothetical protein
VANAGGNIIKARFRQGRMYQTLGYHPIFQILRCVRRIIDPPFVIGSSAILAGYIYNLLRFKVPVLDENVVRHLRSEQIKRIRDTLYL